MCCFVFLAAYDSSMVLSRVPYNSSTAVQSVVISKFPCVTPCTSLRRYDSVADDGHNKVSCSVAWRSGIAAVRLLGFCVHSVQLVAAGQISTTTTTAAATASSFNINTCMI